MSELQQLPDMTLEEAQIEHAELKALEGVMRSKLLRMRDRKGWKALGFSSWEEYGEKEWNFSLSQLDRLATAARIEKYIPPIGGLQNPETHLRPLAKIPENEIAAIWEEANRKAEEAGKERTAKMVQDAVNEWKAKHEAIQKQLDVSDELYRDTSEKLYDLSTKQQQIIDAKVAEEKAKLILENQQAIADAKRERDNAANELERLKREQAKAIADGVKRELFTMQNEIDIKQHSIESFNKRIDALREVENSLEREVGYLQTHKKAIEKIKDNLSFLTVSFSDAFDTNVIPAEVFSEWQSISYAVSKLNKQLLSFVTDYAPLESHAIEGELVDA